MGKKKQPLIQDEDQKVKKKRGGKQRHIRRQLVELHKLAAITCGPFKSKLLIKINNLKNLKKKIKNYNEEQFKQILKENSV